MLSTTIAVRDISKIRSDAFPIGKYGNEDRDYLSVDFYDYDGNRDITGHLRLIVPYEQAVELYEKIGLSLNELDHAKATVELASKVTA
jgi:hypothetical protein